MKLERSIERYRNGNPEVIAKGSEAQILFALQDSRKDILALAAEVERLTNERERIEVSLEILDGQETESVGEQWRAIEDGAPKTSWCPVGYGDEAGWRAIANRHPDKYQIQTRPVFAHPHKNWPELLEALRAIEKEAAKATSRTHAVAVSACQRIKDLAHNALPKD
jgi:hypothetical protein